MIKTNQSADAGFHAGELAVQRQAGVLQDAARMSRMLEPVELSGGIAGFLADRTFLVITGRDLSGRLWTSPIVGPPGFLDVRSPTTLAVRARISAGDPLHGIPVGQKLGMTAVEFATRRRVRINGLVVASTDDLLEVEVEQAYGNCPQYIQQRLLTPDEPDPSATKDVRRGTELSPDDIDLIRSADTFFLGTVNPERGADASHRGGPPRIRPGRRPRVVVARLQGEQPLQQLRQPRRRPGSRAPFLRLPERPHLAPVGHHSDRVG